MSDGFLNRVTKWPKYEDKVRDCPDYVNIMSMMIVMTLVSAVLTVFFLLWPEYSHGMFTVMCIGLAGIALMHVTDSVGIGAAALIVLTAALMLGFSPPEVSIHVGQ